MSKPVLLDPAQAAFVEGLVTTGRFPSTNDAVAAGLRLLHAREARLSELREAWREDVESGDYEPVDSFLDDLAAEFAMPIKAGP